MISAYGSVAGSAALQWLPTGGLYIAGGLAPKNFKWFTKKPQEIFSGLVADNQSIFKKSFKVGSHLCCRCPLTARPPHARS